MASLPKNIIALPAIVGDCVFMIRDYHRPKSDWRWGSKPRIVKAVITEIGCDKKGWYIITQEIGSYGGTRSKLDSLGVSWFVEATKAQAKLTELLNK